MSNIEDLADRIAALPLPERLRLAAQLIENDRPMLAKAIVDAASLELEAAQLLKPVNGEDRKR